MEKKNPFKDAEVIAAKKTEEAPVQTGRKTIDENSVLDSKWLNLPGEDGVGEVTPVLRIKEYFQQPGKEMKNKTSGDLFWTGLKGKEGELLDEYIIEGYVEEGEEVQSLRLSNWEVYYKMLTLVRYCKANNFTLINQKISFERANHGRKNAGTNWILHVPSLKIKIVGKDSNIEVVK